jgi:zinc protease
LVHNRVMHANVRAPLAAAFLASTLCTALLAQSNHAEADLKLPEITYQKIKLPNGLEVITHEDHRLPLVALDIWYHVGPLNEKAGRTGFAHLFEHMMFEGSEHVGEKAHFRYLEGAGATGINGTTDFDRTNYFETLPSNQLELGLWLESDRMGFLLEKLDRERLTNQRDVVRNERRQGEGMPYELGQEEMFHLLFPKQHPYYASVIGSHADIESSRISDVRDFFRQYYAPNNATLAIAGDFDSAALKGLLDKYFGPIPAGPRVDKVQVDTPAITKERRATVTDTVQLPRVSVAWLTPPAFTKSEVDSHLFMQILGGGKSSRLYKELVYKQQIAQTAECDELSLALTSVANCDITARPGVKPEALEAALDRQIEELQKTGPTEDELNRARNMILSRKIERLQKLGGFGGVADMMNLYNQYLGDPGYLPKDVTRYRNATIQSVHSESQAAFSKDHRVTVYTVAGKKMIEDVPRSPENTDADVKLTPPYSADFEKAEAWRSNPPAAGPSPKLNLPVPAVFSLSNGMKVYLVEDHALPVFNATVLDMAGAEANPKGKPGLASFTARMLVQGTATRSALQIADESDGIGAQLASDADEDSAHASLSALSNQTDAAFKLLSDVLQHPAFKADEVERIRKERLARITEESDQPFASGLRVGRHAIFGEGPYGHPPSGTKASVTATTRDDLQSFWGAHYAPQRAALVLSGDISTNNAHELATRYFGNWSAPGATKDTTIPSTPDAPKRHVIIVDKPGAPQTALFAFGVGLPRTTPDYAAVNVMNSVLGGLFSSRINMNLREKNGFTYGAFSDYWFHRGAGPFYAGALVRTDVTTPAARELFTELNRIRTDPPTPTELRLAQDNALRSLPGQFETARVTSQLIGELFVYNLPVDYYKTLPSQYDSLTPVAVEEAARKNVHPAELVVIAVGDRQKIQPGLEKLDLGPTELRNESGDLVNK